jgi:uncharacterized membrane protein YidH (DUF202 family)
MTPLAHITLLAFIVIWFLAAGTWFYGTWHWFKFMNARRNGEPYQSERQLALKSYAAFASLILLGFAVGADWQFSGRGLEVG